MNNGNFSKIKWVVLCICLLAGGFFLLKNLNIQSVDQYDKESDRIAGRIQIKEAATGSSVTAAAVAETTETPPLSSASPDKAKKDKKKKTAKDAKETATPTPKAAKAGSKTDKTGGKKKQKKADTSTAAPSGGKNGTAIQTPGPAVSQAPTAAPAGESGNKNNEIRCTIDITCHHLVEQGDKLDANVKKYVPKNGVILSNVEVTVPQGSTVYDVLNQVCRSKGIKVDAEYTKIYETYYIKGIANLYEMQAGDMSGWMYTVNQVTPNVGCSSYTLKDGDVIHWIYTCDGKI